MPQTEQDDRERSRAFYARISAANAARGAHTRPGSPSAVRRAPVHPNARDYAPWSALRIAGVALLVHAGG